MRLSSIIPGTLIKSSVIKKDPKSKKWILWTKDGTRKLGTHDTAQEAYKQEYAIEKSMQKKASFIVPNLFVKESAFKLNPSNADNLYNAFRDSYIKATGKAWDKPKFLQRASNWEFFGPDDASGFLAVRPQKDNLFKLVGSAGSPRGVLKGIKELQQDPNRKIWGAISEDLIAPATKHGMMAPHLLPGGPSIVEQFVKNIPSRSMGGVTPIVTETGALKMSYPDVGDVEKYLVGSPSYFSSMVGSKIPGLGDSEMLKTLYSQLTKKSSESKDLLKEADGNRATRRSIELARQNPVVLKQLIDAGVFPGPLKFKHDMPLNEVFEPISARPYGRGSYSVVKDWLDAKKNPRTSKLVKDRYGIEESNMYDSGYDNLKKLQERVGKSALQRDTGYDAVTKNTPKFARNTPRQTNRLRHFMEYLPDTGIVQEKPELKDYVNRVVKRPSLAIPIEKLPYDPENIIWKAHESEILSPETKNYFGTGVSDIAAGYQNHGSESKQFLHRIKTTKTREGKPQTIWDPDKIDPTKPFYTHHAMATDPQTRLDKLRTIRDFTPVEQIKFDPDYRRQQRNSNWLHFPHYETIFNLDKPHKTRFMFEGDKIVPFKKGIDKKLYGKIRKEMEVGRRDSIRPFTKEQIDSLISTRLTKEEYKDRVRRMVLDNPPPLPQPPPPKPTLLEKIREAGQVGINRAGKSISSQAIQVLPKLRKLFSR
jgi:hypothetical protein